MNRRTALMVVGAIFGGMLLLFAMCGGLFYYGSQEFERQVAEAFERNPVIQDYIGSEIVVTYDEAQSMELPGPTEFCYDVSGPQGTGTVYADLVTVDADTEKIGYGVLKLSSGEAYDLITGEEVDGDDIERAMSALRNGSIGFN